MHVIVDIDGERRSIEADPGESPISHNRKLDVVFEKMAALDLDSVESVEVIVKTKAEEEPDAEGAL